MTVRLGTSKTHIVEFIVPQVEHFQLNEPIHRVRQGRERILAQRQHFQIDQVADFRWQLLDAIAVEIQLSHMDQLQLAQGRLPDNEHVKVILTSLIVLGRMVTLLLLRSNRSLCSSRQFCISRLISYNEQVQFDENNTRGDEQRSRAALAGGVLMIKSSRTRSTVTFSLAGCL